MSTSTAAVVPAAQDTFNDIELTAKQENGLAANNSLAKGMHIHFSTIHFTPNCAFQTFMRLLFCIELVNM